MMLESVNGQLSVYRGAYRPVNVYKNGKQIAGWEEKPVSGTSASAEYTYDGTAESLTVNGWSERKESVNLCPPPQSVEETGISLSVNADGRFYFSYASGTHALCTLASVPLPAGTYTASASGGQYLLIDWDGLYWRGMGSAQTFTLDAPATVTIAVPENVDANVMLCLFYLQIERGETASAYEPYNNPIADPAPDNIRNMISAKGSVQSSGGISAPYHTDSVILPELRAVEVSAQGAAYSQFSETDENGVTHYYIADTVQGNTLTRRIGVKVFDGKEVFSYASAFSKGTSICCFTLFDNPIKNSSSNYQAGLLTGMMNIGQVVSIAYINNYVTALGYNSNPYEYLRIAKSAIPDLSDSDSDADKVTKFKAYLAYMYEKGTPVTVYYILAEPVTETLESEPLKTFPKYTELSVLPDAGRPCYRLSGGIKAVKRT